MAYQFATLETFPHRDRHARRRWHDDLRDVEDADRELPAADHHHEQGDRQRHFRLRAERCKPSSARRGVSGAVGVEHAAHASSAPSNWKWRRIAATWRPNGSELMTS